MSDFKLYTDNGKLMLDASATETSVINNITMSLSVRKGSWWFNPDFGCELYKLRTAKASSATAELVKTYVKTALDWLVSSRRLETIEIATEIVPAGGAQRGRINYVVTAYPANGDALSYSNFVEVA